MSKKLLFLSIVLLFLPVLAFAEHHEEHSDMHEGHEGHEGHMHEPGTRMEKRKMHCEEHPDDERCVKMKKKLEERKARHEAMREACGTDSQSEKCQAMKEEMKAKMQERRAKHEAMMEKCKSNPKECRWQHRGEGKDGMRAHPKKMRGEKPMVQ